MRVAIVANGQISPPVQLKADDLIIAADGGAHNCLDLGLTPAYVIGDLDSLDDWALQTLRERGVQIIQYPRRKDYTDLELALRHALALGADDILVLAALGARWDQTIANLLLPAAFLSAQNQDGAKDNPISIRLIDGNQEIQFLHGGKQICLTGQPGDTVSLIPLGGDAHGINTQNLEYPLSDGTIRFGSTLGVSNVLLAESACVSLRQGLLLCTVIHHSFVSDGGE